MSITFRTLDISIEEDVFANEFCKIAIHIKPGARNSEKGTPLISITLLLKPQQKSYKIKSL